MPHEGLSRRAFAKAAAIGAAATLAPPFALDLLAANSFPFSSAADQATLDAFTRNILNPGMASRFGTRWRDATDIQQCHWLRQFARSWLSNGFWERAPGERGFLIAQNSYMTLQAILDWRAQPKGDGQCAYYSQFFFYVCRAAGMVCRRIWWDDGVASSDQSTEVWVPSLHKWVAQSVLLNAWFSGPSGGPLSTWEMSELYHAGRGREITIERNGVSTLPDPTNPAGPITPAMVRAWSADVCIFRKVGDHPGGNYDVNVYRYAAAARWPYPVMESKQKYVIGLTFEPMDLWRPPDCA